MDYNLWQELLLGATKPFRVGANVLGQNWGSALTGKDMSQSENQGTFLKWLAGGITPEEQTAINEKPYLEALKSSAGMAATLAPFASQSLRSAQFAANPLTNRVAQLASQGALEGGLGGFGYSRPGREFQDTLMGAGLGAGGELAFEALLNPQFRSMIGESLSANDLPGTMPNMYGGAVGGISQDELDVLRDAAYKASGVTDEMEQELLNYYASGGVTNKNPLLLDIEILQRANKTPEGYAYIKALADSGLVDPGQVSLPLRGYETDLFGANSVPEMIRTSSVKEGPSATKRNWDTGNVESITYDPEALSKPKTQNPLEGLYQDLVRKGIIKR